MMFLLNRLREFLQKHAETDDGRAKYIFYRIVDSDKAEEEYILQRLNSRIIFRASITDVVFDRDLLSGLSPRQACYIGLEYAKYLQTHSPALQKKLKPNSGSYLACRYGKYRIVYQDRVKNICFIDLQTKEEFLMDPRDIH